MNENIKRAIKQTMATPGWKYVLELFEEEFISGKKVTSFVTEGKTNEMIAREVTAKEISAKAIDKIMKKLDKIKNAQEKPEGVVYK